MLGAMTDFGVDVLLRNAFAKKSRIEGIGRDRPKRDCQPIAVFHPSMDWFSLDPKTRLLLITAGGG
jgi:hypothetical protein